MNESEKQFSFTRAALRTGGPAKSKLLTVISFSYMKAKLSVGATQGALSTRGRWRWQSGLSASLIHFSLLTAFTAVSQILGDGSGPSRPAPAPVTQAMPPAANRSGTNLIVRLYYGDRSRLDQLVGQYDIFEFADHDAGYVAARLRPAEYRGTGSIGISVGA